jgi:hypothetical protein
MLVSTSGARAGACASMTGRRAVFGVGPPSVSAAGDGPAAHSTAAANPAATAHPIARNIDTPLILAGSRNSRERGSFKAGARLGAATRRSLPLWFGRPRLAIMKLHRANSS